MTKSAEGRIGLMRAAPTTVLVTTATGLAATGVIALACGLATGSRGAVTAGVVLCIPLIAAAFIAAVATIVVVVYHLSHRSVRTEKSARQLLREAGLTLIEPHENNRKPPGVDLTPVPLAEPSGEPVQIRHENEFEGVLWPRMLKAVIEFGGGYDGFRYKEFNRASFLLTLPRKRNDWINNSDWLRPVCIDLVEDKHLQTIVFDLNHPEDNATVGKIITLLLEMDTKTALPQAAVRQKLRLAKVTNPLLEALYRYNIGFTLFDGPELAQ